MGNGSCRPFDFAGVNDSDSLLSHDDMECEQFWVSTFVELYYNWPRDYHAWHCRRCGASWFSYDDPKATRRLWISTFVEKYRSWSNASSPWECDTCFAVWVRR